MTWRLRLIVYHYVQDVAVIVLILKSEGQENITTNIEANEETCLKVSLDGGRSSANPMLRSNV
jgi:hypothetical protein